MLIEFSSKTVSMLQSPSIMKQIQFKAALQDNSLIIQLKLFQCWYSVQ